MDEDDRMACVDEDEEGEEDSEENYKSKNGTGLTATRTQEVKEERLSSIHSNHDVKM